jgi:hypothetical protein
MHIGATVDMKVSPDAAFGFLSNPQNRPLWQNTLRSVELIDANPAHLGQRWRETTTIGLVPQLQITVFDPPVLAGATWRAGAWAETGTWRSVQASLRLDFLPVEGGCRVVADGTMSGSGLLRLPTAAVALIANREIGNDLRRAEQYVLGLAT